MTRPIFAVSNGALTMAVWATQGRNGHSQRRIVLTKTYDHPQHGKSQVAYLKLRRDLTTWTWQEALGLTHAELRTASNLLLDVCQYARNPQGVAK